ncbi:MAG: pyridoxamine 5'-phosphate oxidase family protein [Alphaproteobacteria bacterium]|nr:pyridoxamine 5'-phosphate oxidase family protein [Alphaproteobacteria bacterium]MBU1514884.1 pyridoxamine 5'-phosphate oxidase family protein [Alphaproteobacteria bacterium]MBU2093805.1 pyridoxamine 5'-phosphate oxidase family protein [Alphaproteobacteria bacterium]MBU2149426.1 pyridoxamine 5'-phosphate oxidase family protein [Alphaproteobacteria bacterium]MBU2305386.1 pyridoxamine 5'-phosphate oxidase family protein [Alphaproteobacteria bacterium]
MSPPADGAAFTPTARSQVRRRPQRARYDEAAVYKVLDAGIMAHVGYVIDGQPFVTPTAYWREGRKLYWHGAAASRMLATVADGAPACVTVSFLDGFIVGRSGIMHSLNYRSVMAFGRARLVDDPAEKRAAMASFIDRLYAGRALKLRPTTDTELRQIALVEMEIEEASAKVRDSGVGDLPADEGWPAWCGVFPVETRIGAALPQPGMGTGGAPTPDLAPYREGARLDDTLATAAKAYGLPVST